MTKRLTFLTVVSLLAWAVLAYPAQRWWPETALVHSAVALALCLVPAALTLAWAGWALRRSPEQQLAAVLGGTGVRMVLVLGAGLALYSLVPFFARQSFLIWLVVFYLITLALEVGLAVAGQEGAAPEEGRPVAPGKDGLPW